MLVKVLFCYIYGFVRVSIEGYYIERFINICTNKKIIIWNLKKIISIFVASKENRRDDKTKSHDSELVVAPVELRNKR